VGHETSMGQIQKYLSSPHRWVLSFLPNGAHEAYVPPERDTNASIGAFGGYSEFERS